MARAAALAVLVVVVLTVGQVATSVPAGAGEPGAAERAGGATATQLVERDVCAATSPVPEDTARCFAVERVPVGTAEGTATPFAAGAPVGGITVPQLQSMYGIAGRTPPVATTVAVVVAFDDPAAESNLARFRSYWGLPACTTTNGCLSKVDQRGSVIGTGATTPPKATTGWRLESALDLQAVSAVCPGCRVLLVEADSARITDLGAATATAGALGATIISNSFGATESSSQASVKNDWNQPGVTIFAATGDNGWENFASTEPSVRGYANFPASSAAVTAVGGTSATIGSSGTITAESAWSGSGSACSITEPRPAWQQAYFDSQHIDPDPYENSSYFGCTLPGSNGASPSRATADLSTIADPAQPGFPVFVDGGWTVGGGTSLSAPLVAGLQALAGPRGTGTGVSQVAYRLGTSRSPSATSAQFTDITSGSNGGQATCYGEPICTSMPGWDGPTGLGAVRSVQPFLPLLSLGAPSSVAGGQLSFTGANYLPNEQVSVTVGTGQGATFTADTAGNIRGAVTVPASTPMGTTTVSAHGASSGFAASLPVTVSGATLSGPTAGVAALSSATVAVAGFAPGETVVVTAGSSTTSVVVSAAGSGTASFPVPADAPDSLPVSAVGRTSGRSASTTIRVLAPGVTPTTTTAAGGASVRLTVTGFGAGETLQVSAGGTASGSGASGSGTAGGGSGSAGGGSGTAGAGSGSTGSALGTATADGNGSATLNATVPTSAAVGRTLPLVVTGTSTRRSATALVLVSGSTAASVTPPTLLSAAPLANGTGAVVGVRVDTATPLTSVTVYASDGTSVVVPAASITSDGDLFATFSGLLTGRSYTFVAVSNGSAADSAGSGSSGVVSMSTVSGAGDLTPVGPVRRYDSRVADGRLGPAESRTLCLAGTAGVPAAGVSSVVLSLTATDTTDTSFLTVWPTGESRPTVSNANFVAGQTKASLAKVKLGPNGCVNVYNNQGLTTVVVDVVGFYAADSGVFAHNQSYASLAAPVRTLDTRTLSSSPLRSGPGTITAVVRDGVSGITTGVPADATSVELNVQAVQSTATSFLTVWPTGAAGGRPLVSNAQFAPELPTSTAVVTGIGTDGTVSIYANAGTEVIVDVIGYYAPSAAGRFVPISPRRYLDTRITGNPLGVGSVASVPVAGAAATDGSTQVPSSATAASLELITTDNSGDTYLTAFAAGTSRPFVTNLLPHVPQGLYDNLALAAVGSGGDVAVYNNVGTVNLIVDVQGYYRAAS